MRKNTSVSRGAVLHSFQLDISDHKQTVVVETPVLSYGYFDQLVKVCGAFLVRYSFVVQRYFGHRIKKANRLSAILFFTLKSDFFSKSFSLRLSTVRPKLLLSSNRLMAEEKQNVAIACNATGQPQPSITWSSAVGSLPKDRTTVMNGVLNIYQLTRNDGGLYICRAKNILGSATDRTQLMIFSALRFKVRPPKNLTPVIGSTVLLPCVAESDLRPTITWTKDDKSSLLIDGNTLLNGTLVLQSIKKSHEGFYTCRVINALTTIEAKVKINSPVATSCSVIRKYVSSASGNYVIDPDVA